MAWRFLTSPKYLLGYAQLLGIGGVGYHLNTKLNYNLEEQEARLDEIEGTLRGHIGLIEESLDRIKGKNDYQAGEKMQALYSTRARYEKQQEEKKEVK